MRSPTPSDGPEEPSDVEGNAAPSTPPKSEPGPTPTFRAMTKLATEAWYIVMVVALIAFAPIIDSSNYANPITVVFGSLAVLLLLYQAGFLLVYPTVAADQGVPISSRYSHRYIESEFGVRLLALADLGFLIFVLATVLSSPVP